MPPKKKVKVENVEEAEGGGGGGEGGEGGPEGGSMAIAAQQAVGVGGPEAPKLDLEGCEVFEYAPGKALEGVEAGALIRVEVESKFLTTENEGVKQRRVWGSDPYTVNSDLVAVAMHSSVYVPTTDAPKFAFLVIAVRIHPKVNISSHNSSSRNGIKSRAVTGYEVEGLSMRVEGHAFCKTAEDKAKLTKVLLRPTRQERVSIKGNSALAEARIVFNLSNEPAYKYSLAVVADRAPDAKCWTSVRFKTQALYFETIEGRRFELSYEEDEDQAAADAAQVTAPTYRLAEVPRPRVTDKKTIQAMAVPIPALCCAVQHSAMAWNEIVWGPTTIAVRGTVYNVKCCFWLPVSSAVTSS